MPKRGERSERTIKAEARLRQILATADRPLKRADIRQEWDEELGDVLLQNTLHRMKMAGQISYSLRDNTYWLDDRPPAPPSRGVMPPGSGHSAPPGATQAEKPPSRIGGPPDTPPEAPERPQETRSVSGSGSATDESIAETGADDEQRGGKPANVPPAVDVPTFLKTEEPAKVLADGAQRRLARTASHLHITKPDPDAPDTGVVKIYLDIELTAAEVAEIPTENLSNVLRAAAALLVLDCQLLQERGEP